PTRTSSTRSSRPRPSSATTHRRSISACEGNRRTDGWCCSMAAGSLLRGCKYEVGLFALGREAADDPVGSQKLRFARGVGVFQGGGSTSVTVTRDFSVTCDSGHIDAIYRGLFKGTE